jgi:hypothetical protein
MLFFCLLFNHLDVRLGADGGAIAAALAIGEIATVGILGVALDAAFRADQKAHLTGDTVFLQKFWP